MGAKAHAIPENPDTARNSDKIDRDENFIIRLLYRNLWNVIKPIMR